MAKKMIKRADGSYSQRGLWDNIRANKGSGKKPTAEMLKQEKKIKRAKEKFRKAIGENKNKKHQKRIIFKSSSRQKNCMLSCSMICEVF